MKQKYPNPWLGLRSYQEGETLFGRSDEIISLTQCILSNIQTVLYGRSGIGKTSILNAGVFPAARKKGVFPVNIRLVHNGDSYLSQISCAVFHALKNLRKDSLDDNGDRVSVYESGTYKERTKALGNGVESLWEFLHRHEFYDASGNRIKPLLVFDQFEEIFTIEKDKSKVRCFFDELADLLNGVVPEYISAATDDYSAGNASKSTDDGLAFDLADFNVTDEQYEDYLTTSDFHIVFTLREDFLSYLERETFRIPSLRQNRYCLQSINEEQASIIIMNPLPGLVSKDVAKLIIQKVTGETAFELDGKPEISVDSSILSLYLSRLFDSLGPEDEVFSSALVEKEAENIIQDFYEDSTKDIPSEVVEYLEDNLVNGEGRRESVSSYNARHDGKLTSEILSKLVDERKLLRQLDYGGGLRIEFIHDILCPVVMNRKSQRKLMKEQEEAERQNKQEALRLKREKDAIIRSKKRTRKLAIVLAVIAAIMAGAAMLIFSMNIKNKQQKASLDELNDRIKGILPSVIEQKIKEGDSYTAGSFLAELFPDSLYKAGDAQRITLLRKLSCTSAEIFEGHTQSVNAVAISKDGRIVVSGSDDRTVRVWDAVDNKLLTTADVRSDVTSVSISPAGDLIAVATKNGQVAILSNMNEWKQQVMPGNTYPRFITFSPDGSKIYACCVDGFVYMFDSKSLDSSGSFKTSSKGATYISFDPSGKQMVLAGSDNTITIRDLDGRSVLSTFIGHDDWVRSVEYSPDGRYLVSTSDDKSVRIWSIASHFPRIVEILQAWGTKASFTPNGKMIVSSSKDGMLRFFDVESMEEISDFRIQHSGSVNSFDISSDGRRVITCSTDPTIHVWDCGDVFDTGISMSMGQDNAIYGMARIPNSTRVAVSSQDGVFTVWDTVTGSLVYSVSLGSGDNGRASSLDVSPDGRWVALSTRFKVRLFNASTGEEMQMDNSRGHRGWVRDLCFSHDGQMIASVGEDKKIILWDVESRTVSKRMDAHSAGIYCVDFSHDDTRLVTGSADFTICQWSVGTGELIGKPLVGHQGLVKSVHFNRDDSRILSASADKTACIWDVEGNIIQQFVGASSDINDVIWSESEEEVITASNDKYVRVWCVANGKETARLEGHFGGVSRLSLSEDGDTLVSSDYIGGVKVWRIPSLSAFAESLSEKYSQR